MTREPLLWIVFGITYAGIALGRFPRLVLDRTGIALLGAIAMLAVHGISISEAARHIDCETMLLLFGLMIFSAQLRVAGFYVMAGRFLTRLTDRPKTLLAGIIAVSAVLSALLANDIVCLAFTPLLCDALLGARKDPVPYLLALATSSNIGSAATLIGNPQNMYIGTVARLPFGHFMLVTLPVVIVGLGLCWLMTVLLFHRRFGVPPSGGSSDHLKAELRTGGSSDLLKAELRTDNFLITKTLLILAALVVFFLAKHGQDAAEWRAIAALTGAGILLCSHRAKAARLYQLVDWNLLLLFIGLFVVNGAMQERGLTRHLFQTITSHGVNLNHPVQLSGVTLVLSNLVSNVPAVLLLQPSLAAANSRELWYLLALVSTWAGNLTLVGSIANLIVAESARAFGVQVNLKTYCILGIPLTLVTVAMGTAWLMMLL